MMTPPFASHCPMGHFLFHLLTPLFTYLENQLLLLMVRIPIHSCPWFSINCSPLAASPTPRHPTDQVTYLHRRHQQHRGLLDRSTARYFYKRLKTSLHKPRGNLLENLFSKKCALKNNLKLLEKKFLSQTSTTPKHGILLHKMAHFQDSSIFQ
jgi:hypothetical protein